MECSYGRPKTPEHLVFCRKSLGAFDLWPWPDKKEEKGKGPRPQTDEEKIVYLRMIIEEPRLFREFLKRVKFYEAICPR